MPGALQGLRWRIIATREPRMADSFAAQLADALGASWPAIARPNQLPPPGDWQVWLLLAGRGFGKTRTLAEWVNGYASRRHPDGPAGLLSSPLPPPMRATSWWKDKAAFWRSRR